MAGDVRATDAVDRASNLLSIVRDVLLRGVVLMALALVGLATWQSARYLLAQDIERIVVKGAHRYTSPAELEALVTEHIDAGLLALDLEGVRAQLQSQPWILDANVRRRWPDTLVIEIEEQRPVARWGAEGFVNHAGDFFPGHSRVAERELPQLEGPEGTEQLLMEHYLTIESLLSSTGLQIAWLAVDELGQVSAELTNGVLIKLGDTHLVRRTRRFVQLHVAALSTEDVLKVDLRYEQGAAVQFYEPEPESQFSQYEDSP